MAPPTLNRSASPQRGRPVLLTFDANNTLTINDPSARAIEFDAENRLVSTIPQKPTTAAIVFNNENKLVTSLPVTLPPASVPTQVEVVLGEAVPRGNTWPPSTAPCTTCAQRPGPVRRPSLFISTTTDEAIDRYATLQRIMVGASLQELKDMKAALKLELHSRQPSRLMVQAAMDSDFAGSGTSAPTSTTRERHPSALRGWEATNRESANESYDEDDMEV